ncbi:hypothetical protein ACOMHN_046639 [Nucella lapillus]
MPTLERNFWRRKLPRSMMFHLKNISRELMLAETKDYNQQAADFFQELLNRRTGELKMLPAVSYLDKIFKKLGLERPTTPPSEPCPPPINWVPSASNMTTHMEGHMECKVIAIPHPGRDAFSHLIAHVTGADPEEGPSDLRFLSFLVDY